MNSIKIIFSDLDGTLLNSAHRVSRAAAAKLRALHAQGVPFVIVSARMPAAVFPIQEQIGFACPSVCYGGALSLDENRRPIRSVRLGEKEARAVLQFMQTQTPHAAASVYAGDVWYAQDPSDPRIKEESRITGVEPIPFGANPQSLRPHKIFYILNEKDAPAALKILRAQFPALHISYSGWGHIEVMNKEARKSEGLKSVCQYLNVPPQNAVAFGDSANDIDMLRAAGLGVAMANAAPEVKDAADLTTASNDEDGVLRTLEKLF